MICNEPDTFAGERLKILFAQNINSIQNPGATIRHPEMQSRSSSAKKATDMRFISAKAFENDFN